MSLSSASSLAAVDATAWAYEPSLLASSVATASVPNLSTVHGEAVVWLQPKYGRAPIEVAVRYFWHGAVGVPTVIVQGGISASRKVCTVGDAAGWWDELAGRGAAIDLERCRVLSIDWLAAADLGGVCAVSSEDQADALAALLDVLGIARVQAFVGSSYGAMVGLAFAARHAPRLGRLVAISGAHRAHPLATALRAIQREIVRGGISRGDVDGALALARQLAMTTYRGADEFAERFDAAPEFRDGRRGAFGAVLQQHLHAHADAEQRLGGGGLQHRFEQARLAQLAHAVGDGALPRQHHAVRGAHLGRVGRDDGVDVRVLRGVHHGLRHRAQVAHAVVDHGNGLVDS